MDSESLIMAERQHHHDKDINIAQKIHTDCDRQFADEVVAATAAADSGEQQQIIIISNGNGIDVGHGDETHHLDDAKDVVLVDSLNVEMPPVADEDDAPAAEEIQEEEVILHNQVPVEEEEEAQEEPVVNSSSADNERNEEMRRRMQREEKIVKPRRIFEEEIKPPMEPLPVGPRKGAIPTSMDADSVRDAYNDIRDDNSETKWAVFKYDATRIICSAKGIAFDEFKAQFGDNERAYGYIRLQTGDEMSKRHKFLFVTWIGPGVNVIKRAKMSIDKAIIKHVVSNFAVELQLETLSDIDLPFFIESLNKASGANYGTGIRDI